ncbi:MAG: hypothetical protein KGL39_20780 [Patescibacteria group bacterium]|nr:hypothetical protein [Patescibacteria group bacterium]
MADSLTVRPNDTGTYDVIHLASGKSALTCLPAEVAERALHYLTCEQGIDWALPVNMLVESVGAQRLQAILAAAERKARTWVQRQSAPPRTSLVLRQGSALITTSQGAATADAYLCDTCPGLAITRSPVQPHKVGQPVNWNITHLHSGCALELNVSLPQGRRMLTVFANSGVDWTLPAGSLPKTDVRAAIDSAREVRYSG